MKMQLHNAGTDQGRVVAAILRAKGLNFEPHEDSSKYATEFEDEPTLIDNGHVIHGAIVISLYAEQKYPYPSLMPRDPEKSSIVMMLYRSLLQTDSTPADFRTYKMHLGAHGHITGDRPSFVDFAIAALAPPTDKFWPKYHERLMESIGSFTDDALDIA